MRPEEEKPVHLSDHDFNIYVNEDIRKAKIAKNVRDCMDVIGGAKTTDDITREKIEWVIEEAKDKNYNLNVSYVLHLDNEQDNIPEPEEEEER